MIVLDRVSKSFIAGGARKWVLRDVSMTLPRGRSVGILGRNGAGKSTLLKMISGATVPDSGEIRLQGAISWPLGFSGGLHGALTGAQNARFIARIYGADTRDMMKKTEAFAELGPFLHMPVSTYSSGMRARLAFAVSMAVDFDMYLVDEITAVGDVAFQRKCAAAFRSRMGQADVIMISHSDNTIRQYCDAGIVLEGGRMIWFDDIEQALATHGRNMAS